MLALTRKVNEEIVIGDPRNPLGIIRVVDIHGDKVRLAFDFPRETEINRRELADEKAKEATTGQVRPGSCERGSRNQPIFSAKKPKEKNEDTGSGSVSE